MLINSKCIKDMKRKQTRVQSPVPAKNFQWYKVMRIEGSNVAAANFDFQASFHASLSSQKIQRKFLKDSQSRRKREQNYLCGNQSRRIRESTHHSSHNRAVAVGERQEQEKQDLLGQVSRLWKREELKLCKFIQ
jgi:hypothetical protein